MGIKGVEGLTIEQLNEELQMGGRFVVYQYCVSILIMTFKRGSGVYFIRNGESAFVKGLGYTLVSLIFGWWGIPWGPIYTIGSIVTNCAGGKDVTQEVINSMNNQVRTQEHADAV